MPFIREAVAEDVFPVAVSMRLADAAECEASGYTQEDALAMSFRSSEGSRWTIVDGDEPIAMFGAADCTDALTPDADGRIGSPWLLGKDALVTTHKSWFLRNTPKIVGAADDRYSQFFNKVDARNTIHVRWLRWAGFLILPPRPWGPFGMDFHFFYRKVDQHV